MVRTANETQMQRIVIPKPISANRYWRHFRGVAVLSDAARDYKRDVAILARLDGIHHPMQGEIEVFLSYHPHKPKRITGNIRRLDLDNTLKVTIDSLNGIAWLDDAQIVKIHARVAEPIEGGSIVVEWQAA
jgi:crossover junction endodeoxyribonuclease RusA